MSTNVLQKLFESKVHDVIADDLQSGVNGVVYSKSQIIQYIKRNKISIQCCIDDMIEEKQGDESFEPYADWIREYLGECEMR
jgi:hypothetical protein